MERELYNCAASKLEKRRTLGLWPKPEAEARFEAKAKVAEAVESNSCLVKNG